MQRRTVLSGVLALLSRQHSFGAQAAGKLVRIGWVTGQTPESLTPYIAALRAALAELGYVEGQNLLIDFRYGNDSIDRVPELVADLERVPVNIIVAQGSAVSVIAQLRPSLPVAYVFSGDPVSAGFADSLSHPRSNMTGLTLMAAELNGKRLEILREIAPGLRNVAIVVNPEHPGSEIERADSDKAARQLGLKIQYFTTRTRDELSAALAAIATTPVQALSVFSDGFAVANRGQIIDFATAHKMPVISGWPVFADSGAICTYGPRLVDSYRRLASYVDRINRGAKPADLPIERPTTFELVLNFKAAKLLGISIPQSLSLRADRIIE
jgi:putative ABC transport system substrate-binding protein